MYRRTYLALLAGSGLCGTAGCTSTISSTEPTLDPIDGSWPTYRSNAERTGKSESTTLVDTSAPIAWEHSLDGVVYEPLVAGEQIIAGTSAGKVVALTAQTGKQNWTWPAEAAVNAPPTIATEHVYIRSRAGVHAVDLRTGDEQWTRSFETATDAPPAIRGPAPLHHDGVIYCVTPTGDLRAYATADGDELWTASIPDAIRATPAFGAGKLFVTTDAGGVYGIDHNDGGTVWRRRLDVEGAGSAVPVVTDDAVIVGTAGTVWAMEKRTGDIRWRSTPQSSSIKEVMAEEGGSGSGPPVMMVPAVSEDRVVVGVDEDLFTVDLRSGEQRGSLRIVSGRGTMAAPTIVGESGYVCVGSELVSVSLDDGTNSRVTELPGDGSSAAVVDGVAFLGLESGGVVAVE